MAQKNISMPSDSLQKDHLRWQDFEFDVVRRCISLNFNLKDAFIQASSLLGRSPNSIGIKYSRVLSKEPNAVKLGSALNKSATMVEPVVRKRRTSKKETLDLFSSQPSFESFSKEKQIVLFGKGVPKEQVKEENIQQFSESSESPESPQSEEFAQLLLVETVKLLFNKLTAEEKLSVIKECLG